MTKSINLWSSYMLVHLFWLQAWHQYSCHKNHNYIRGNAMASCQLGRGEKTYSCYNASHHFYVDRYNARQLWTVGAGVARWCDDENKHDKHRIHILYNDVITCKVNINHQNESWLTRLTLDYRHHK